MLQISDSLQPSATRLEQLFNSLADGIEGLTEYEQEPIWQPAPENEPQRMAYDLARSGKVMEIGYGGQAGGGKTDTALGIAGTLFERSLIIRREFPMLNDLIVRGDEIYSSDFIAGTKKRWEFDNRIVGLGSCPHEKDWKKYQGRSIGFLGFDEAAELLEAQVNNISGWIRSTGNRNTLLFLGFNPPTTPEGEWIIERYAPWIDSDYPHEPAEPGEIRWFARIDDKEIEVADGEPFEHEGETIYPISRTFIRATLDDNPYLSEQYKRRIDNLPEPLRSKLKYGDFSVRAKDDRWQTILTMWILQAQERGRKTPKPEVALRAISCDPSRGGDNETAIAKLYGNWFDEIIAHAGSDVPDGPAAGNLILTEMETNAPIVIDAIGIGSSVFDYLNGISHLNVYSFKNSEGSSEISANEIYGFQNLRAESWWRFREALDPASGENICLPDSRKLRADLSAPRFKIKNGKIAIEPKEDIVKRLGRSPDYGDAVVMLWYIATNRGSYGWGSAPIQGYDEFRG
jgi:hypothetical protein